MDKSDNSNIMDSDDMLMIQSLEEYEMLMANQYPNDRVDEDMDFGINIQVPCQSIHIDEEDKTPGSFIKFHKVHDTQDGLTKYN
jgi:hypothetical protein